MATSNAPPSGSTQPQTVSGAGGGTNDAELATTDEVKEYCHEGEGENTEHLNSMDLDDIKTELEKDAEEAETPKGTTTSTSNQTGFNSPTNTSVGSHTVQFRPTVVQPMVYTANGFMVPPFPAGTPIYPVTAASIRPLKMELPSSSDWSKSGQGISIPYGYSTGFVPVDQSLRQAYPFIMPGQYVTQMPYSPQQLTAFGTPLAPNAAVHPHSGIITPTQKEKKPHIKKPLNAFMLFMKEKRAEVIKECTLKESAAINQILGKMWHQLDKGEQAKYYEMAREERAKHMQMYPGWSARDNYAVHKKRKKRRQKQQPDPEDDNPRKCRARYGMEQQDMWCGPCRRKKKCIRATDDEDEGDDCKDENIEDRSVSDSRETLKKLPALIHERDVDDSETTSTSISFQSSVHIKTEVIT